MNAFSGIHYLFLNTITTQTIIIISIITILIIRNLITYQSKNTAVQLIWQLILASNVIDADN